MFLNVLFKSLKCDPSLTRMKVEYISIVNVIIYVFILVITWHLCISKAFLKRILQACSIHDPPYICGCLFLISEVSWSQHKSYYLLCVQLLKLKSSLWPFIREAEGDEEDFKDVPLEDDPSSSPQPEEEGNKAAGSIQDVQTSYLPKARNPLYSRAECSCLWELVMVSVSCRATTSFCLSS